MLILKNIKRYNIIQVSVIAFIWILMFAIPLLFGNFPEDHDWNAIMEIWEGYGYLLLLFLVNHFLLLPYLFFRKRRLLYFVAAIIVIGVFFFVIYSSYIHQRPSMTKPEMAMQQGPQHPRPHAEKPMPEGESAQMHPQGPQGPPTRTERNERHIGRAQHSGMNQLGPRQKPEPGIPPYANLLILSVLLLGFDTGLSISMKWVKDEQKRIELEKENTENKLTFLRQQVSPHFFMNTLNNIHALIDINQEEAKESVIKLSHLMNYLIYDTQDDKVMLKDEMEFIASYIELMQLRFSDKVKLDIKIPTVIPQVEIAPLLFISFIENAFKYGISYQSASYVKLNFVFNDDNLLFVINNSKHAIKRREKSGFGIENTRKRLDLLYANAYTLNLVESPDDFTVKLTLPL